MLISNPKIAIIGLGYVGLPLAIEFAKKYPVVGFDVNDDRIRNLNALTDHTGEADLTELSQVLNASGSVGLTLTNAQSDIANCNIFIVTVPTPVNSNKEPDLSALLGATGAVARALKKGDYVIYESTVYPGCTEEDCVPILESVSGLTYNEDFFCGYSPERINPGDKVNSLVTIKKITSGSTDVAAKAVDSLYASIITAGTYLAPSIKVAEAAKVIENAQRDINISFMNEMAMVFENMNIDTQDVLDAASTKWNFLNFRPGLVGGHCIGVDSYYLIHQSKVAGHNPELTMAGRYINDNMGAFVAGKLVRLMTSRGKAVRGSRILILGFAFKENCPDTRNTRVIDIIHTLTKYDCTVDVYDPWADREEVKKEYGLSLLPQIIRYDYDGIIVAVAHKVFLTLDFPKFKAHGAVILDVKSCIDRELVDGRL